MRKIIQFQVMPPDAKGVSSLIVLGDDGTLHELAQDEETGEPTWTALELPPATYDEPAEGQPA